MQQTKKEPLNIKIPVSTAERIDIVTVYTGVSKAEVVFKALERYLKEMEDNIN